MDEDRDREAILAEKARLRALALGRRRALDNKDVRSRRIWEHLRQTCIFRQAQTICSYVAMPEEVQTQEGLGEILAAGKRLVIPFCEERDLKLCRVFSLNELSPGRWGILEPNQKVRQDPTRQVDPAELEVILVPGVAFDLKGRRLGWGKGYYDRLLGRLPPACVSIGLAFSCQIFDQLPQLAHDRKVAAIVTEEGIHVCGPER